jgi:hypothetical protein
MMVRNSFKPILSKYNDLMYPEDGTCENNTLDLTSQDDKEEGPDYICDHCELPMRKAEENLSSAIDGSVVVKRGSYFCIKCGTIWDSLDQKQQRVIKSQEKTGPRIPKPSDDFFFEFVPSNAGLEPKHIERYDPEPGERECLEADGCTVIEEHITTSDGRTIIKR